MKTTSILVILIGFIAFTGVCQSSRSLEKLTSTQIEDSRFQWPDDLQNGNFLNNREIRDLWITDSVVTFGLTLETDSVAYYKSIYKFNENYKSFEYITLSKFPADDRWKNVNKQVLTINENNLCTQSLQYQGDNQEWLLREKTEYNYNSDNKTDTLVKYNWDAENAIWLNSTKIEFSYNSQGLENGRIYYFADYDTHNWKKTRKEELAYNELNEVIENSTMYWDTDNNTWINSVKTTTSYLDGIASTVLYSWDSVGWIFNKRKDGLRVDLYTVGYKGYTFQNNLTWLFDFSEEIGYNDQGKVISQENYVFDKVDSLWTGRTKIYNNYNDLGQLLSVIHYDWRIGGWLLYYKDQFAYNEQGLVFYNCTYSWVSSENRWNKNVSSTSFFTNVSSINNIDYSIVQIYPNPCTNQLSLDFDIANANPINYQIFSPSGSMVKAGTVNSTQSISVELLRTGLYLIQAQCGNRVYTGKFIKN